MRKNEFDKSLNITMILKWICCYIKYGYVILNIEIEAKTQVSTR